MKAIKPPLAFSAVALASSSLEALRPLRWQHPQLARVWGAWAVVRAAASELVHLPLLSSPAIGTESAKQIKCKHRSHALWEDDRVSVEQMALTSSLQHLLELSCSCCPLVDRDRV
jgi:hypothetical protein